LHMVSHASALTISALAYYYTRKNADDARFSFGTGKVNSLAAFASAVLLFVFALFMAWESIKRFIVPVSIEFNQAIFVAVLGFTVNALCMIILRAGNEHNGASRYHNHSGHENHRHSHDRLKDHNLLSAYLHVMADALTSFLAIFALLAGKYLGYVWMDPLMGVAGALLVARWSIGLIRMTSRILLDFQCAEDIKRRIKKAIEDESDNRITDLHIWSVGTGIYAAEIAIVTSVPLHPEHYRALLPEKELGLVHVMVEVHPCTTDDVRAH
ncbi:MAG: CDF family Co(II)/Ni(II) efflux transporter DmeF, partial [bacterium]